MPGPRSFIGAAVRIPDHARLPLLLLAELGQPAANFPGLAAVELAATVPGAVSGATAPFTAHLLMLPIACAVTPSHTGGTPFTSPRGTGPLFPPVGPHE